VRSYVLLLGKVAASQNGQPLLSVFFCRRADPKPSFSPHRRPSFTASSRYRQAGSPRESMRVQMDSMLLALRPASARDISRAGLGQRSVQLRVRPQRAYGRSPCVARALLSRRCPESICHHRPAASCFFCSSSSSSSSSSSHCEHVNSRSSTAHGIAARQPIPPIRGCA
jgi:hypothetical protein